MTERHPLFPLQSILLPGCVIDLQIFEARYLDMLSRCFKQGESFLIVALESGPETGSGDLRFNALGCEALITDWQQRDNGLLGIRVEGGRRGRIDSADVAADGLVSGEISWLPEQADAPVLEQHDDLVVLHDALMQHPLAEGLGLPEVAGSQQRLGYQLAFLLPFSLDQKVALLNLDHPQARLSQINEWLEIMQA
ncbi:LON peptidase substrate-binding domain-containing protein [Halopseudomonas salina]|uniref:ATP-dependent protease n=1 Tax=Halopseudomonas salina TaxID=1323744 RepID=A0ABQ1PNR3_9GAMM|nr:LON peptidase substrate-binding domain-containing protein [Halopseudomonas salina]GGD00112.1 ATP-dependent protease [Halopseudomonas salina]